MAPSLVSRSPAAWPATFSSWPKKLVTPMAFHASLPALRATTGILASVAALTLPAMASGLARVTAMPSTFLSTACLTRLAWLAPSGSEV